MSQNCLLLGFLLSLSVTTPALAQPVKANEDTAATLFSAAEIFFQAEEYERALRSYMEAYQLSSFPDLLFNIGQCYRALGRYREATAAYQGYLDKVPSSPIRREVEQWLAALAPLAAKEPPPPEKREELTPTSTAALTPEAPQPTEASLRRFALPLGLSVGGLALASGAIITNNKILGSGQISDALQYTRLALALSADAAFLGAGVGLFFALRKQEPTATVTLVEGGALLSLGVGGGVR